MKPLLAEVPGQSQSISAASAVSAKGAFWFTTYEGALNGELFVGLPAQLAAIGGNPTLVCSFFKHPSAAYIADL